MATRTSIATDNFDRANVSPIAPNWTQCGDTGFVGTIDLDSNQYRAGNSTSTIGQTAACYWSGAGTFTDHQYSKAIISALQNGGVDDAVGVIGRASGVDTTRTFYYFGIAQNGGASTWLARFGKVVNGTQTSFNEANVTFTQGDSAEIECGDGTTTTTIRALINGVALGGAWTVTDAAIATGQPGIFSMSNSVTFAAGDNWEGGSLTATGGGRASKNTRASGFGMELGMGLWMPNQL